MSFGVKDIKELRERTGAGMLDSKSGALVEVNAETDFVAKNKEFSDFVEALAVLAHKEKPADLEALKALDFQGTSVDEALKALIARIGENMNLRRFEYVEVEMAWLQVIYTAMVGLEL